MTGTPRARLVGLDVARCVALLGMVATHVMDARTPAGGLTTGQWLAGGRASALFAVLAGVSLALMTREPLRGRPLALRSAGIAGRALLIALLGLFLGGLDSGIAVILTYYGALFVLGLPFTLLGARALTALAVGWVALAPVLSHLVRPHLPPRGFESPTFDQLADPGQLASELLLTGYYPVVPWLAYLLVGLALGRADLRDTSLLGGLALSGLGTAVLATQVSRSLVDPAVASEKATGMFGTTPADGDWSWLLVVAPHSATPFDLAQTIGSALLVISCCLLLEQLLPRVATVVLAVVFGAGAMTLTLYSLHVVMRTPGVWPPEEPSAYLSHVVVLLAFGAAFRLLRRRGPLEVVAGLPVRLSRRAAREEGSVPQRSGTKR
ncbi:heparan-alpha-glucosaminide N-acetyltransferase domain-containing protein [Nocardioides renjunii]|uniref:heparan-alpha-glucosaminide N-acetyltransferase domain-containing protein n=1 Tax=Nocardioides renjunii TaxID=3095075 RepID=UPI002AFF3F2E|nr:heparan-alpha-glucosaminide N-acetyltransferase domain-containing protein [Nocardioides sp. S-34]WQQ22182.1 heparan-alpha-glucosaminide N-acetyltransferase domain-containing protein [Nocardioides sp. S-34]